MRIPKELGVGSELAANLLICFPLESIKVRDGSCWGSLVRWKRLSLHREASVLELMPTPGSGFGQAPPTTDNMSLSFGSLIE